MDEILKRDQNHIVVLGAVTNDAGENIMMLRVDPISKRLLVSATGGGGGGGTVTSVATAGLISGGTITGSGTITTSMNTNRLVGRSTAGTGIMEEITLGTGLTLAGGTLSTSAGTITGSGLNTQITYWTGASTQAGSAALTWNNATGRFTITNGAIPAKRAFIVDGQTFDVSAGDVSGGGKNTSFAVVDSSQNIQAIGGDGLGGTGAVLDIYTNLSAAEGAQVYIGDVSRVVNGTVFSVNDKLQQVQINGDYKGLNVDFASNTFQFGEYQQLTSGTTNVSSIEMGAGIFNLYGVDTAGTISPFLSNSGGDISVGNTTTGATVFSVLDSSGVFDFSTRNLTIGGIGYAFPLVQGSAGKVLTNDGSGGLSWETVTGGVSTIGTIDTATPSSNGAVITGASLFLQSASATNPGLVNTTTQSFAGAKTFDISTGAFTLSGGTANITLGSTASNGQRVIIAGSTGDSSVEIAAAQNGGNVFVGNGMTTGVITMGGTSQTGGITIGNSNASNTLNLGVGSGAITVNLGTGITNSKAINIGTGAIGNTIIIGNATGATAITHNTGTGVNTSTSLATTGNAFTFTANSKTTGDAMSLATNALSSGNALSITSTSTAATGNTQKLLNIALSGTNSTSAQTTFAADIANTHAGTTSTNIGLRVSASGGTTANYALIASAGLTGLNQTAPTAILHLGAGGTAANSAPFKFTSGPVNTVAVAAQVEYNNAFYQTNNAANRYALGGILADYFTDVTVGGAETDIYTITTIANTLAVNGEKIISSYSGNFVTVGTELTQLKVYFGGTAIWDSTGVAPTTGTTSWKVDTQIIRVSATAVRYSVSLTTTGASGFVYQTTGELTGLTLSGTNILKITGTSTGVGSGSGDIVGKMGYVRWDGAANL